jgi:DNA-binding PucR family transcriptional regulator
VAVRQGRAGQVEVHDHLAELLLRRSPRLAANLRSRVYDQLAAHGPELTDTLDALIEHDFDRGATAASLPVHRNTLTNRLNRIQAVTGLDVDSADGRGLVWLAWLERSGQSSP